VISGDGRPFALVAAVALLAHATALACGFVWLDHAHIQDGLALAPTGQWAGLLTSGFAGTGFYRPLMALSLSLDAALGGSAWLFHATSLLWHAAAAVLVALAAETLGLSHRAAVLAGVLFAVHPATSLVASAIAFRSESMIAVALLALIVFHRRGRPLPAALALFAGALTKETALVLGVLIIAALELDARLRSRARAPWRLLAAEAGALVAVLALRLSFAPAWRASFVPLGPGAAVGTRLASVAKSALALGAPFDRTICDAFAVSSLLSARALAGALVLAALGFLAWRRRGPALLMLLALLPSLQLVPIMRWWSPHYLYLPLAFAAMLAAELAVARGRRAEWTAAVVAAGFALIVVRDDLRFRNDQTLWAPEVAANAACREGQFFLGTAELEHKQLAQAAARFEAALETSPDVISYVDRGAALQNLGVARLEQNQISGARVAFRAALALVSQEGARRQLTHNLAAVELRAGNAAEAARLLEPEVERPDALPASILVRARALHQLGREAEGLALVRRLRDRSTTDQ
jgi:tetratricopeptide (TPR) repeat protein